MVGGDGPKRDFLDEVWEDAKPYMVKLVVDLLVATSLYLGLYFFKLLSDRLPIPGWAGTFIVNLHSVGIVFAFAVFAGLFIIDVIDINRRRRK